MSKFKVGDKVRLKNNYAGVFKRGDEFTIAGIDPESGDVSGSIGGRLTDIWIDDNQLNNELELVPMYKVGDRVNVTYDTKFPQYNANWNGPGTVVKVTDDYIHVQGDKNGHTGAFELDEIEPLTYKVGDRVKILVGSRKGQEHVVTGINRTVNHGVEILKGAGYGFHEIEPVDTSLSNRVKITVETSVYENQGGKYVELGRPYLDDLVETGATVEYITEPIVLPTGIYALVVVNQNAYINRGVGVWRGVYTSLNASTVALTKLANQYSSTYRVIFEGEK